MVDTPTGRLSIINPFRLLFARVPEICFSNTFIHMYCRTSTGNMPIGRHDGKSTRRHVDLESLIG